MAGNKNSNEDGFSSNLVFFIALIIAFSIAWPLGIVMLLWKFGVFKKVSDKKIGADSKQGLRMDKYSIISDGRSGMSIDYLASAVGVSYDTALRDIQKMVAEGRFGSGAYINYVDRTLIIDPAARRKESAAAAPKNRPSGGADGSNMISRDEASGTKKKGGKTSASQKAKKKSWDMLRFLLIFGVFMTAVGAFTSLSFLPELARSPWYEVLSEMAPLLAMTAGGAACLGYRGFLKRRENRFRLYAAATAGRGFVSISELASKAGVSERRCRRDLEAMLEKKLLPESAYIDQSDGTLVLKPSEAPKAQPEPEPQKDNEDRYKSIIREIRKLNDDIPDEDVSRRIDEMENLASAIFREVQQKPEKEPQIKSFMSYYLPTTLKLLRAYAQFESTGADGENVRAAKAEIEHILDALVDGFRKQLDKLYESDAMDISSDIDVLETMLRRDGLSGDGSAFGAQAQKKK